MVKKNDSAPELPEGMEVSHLRAKNDGRKKAWFIKRIEELESQLEAQTQTVNGNGSHQTNNDDYAQGFIDCMHRFQLMNKAARQNLYRQIIEHGPGAVKRLKGAKFRGVVL